MKEMARFLSEEQCSIIDMNSEAIEESSRQKQEITAQLSSLAEECRGLMMLVGTERGLDNSFTLSQLIDSASVKERQDLEPLQRRLVQLAGTLNRQQETNRNMLVHSLGLIGRSLSLLKRLLGGCDTYGAQGRVNTGTAGVNFVSREI
jgi:hypothetical protein